MTSKTHHGGHGEHGEINFDVSVFSVPSVVR
jgi:hypothetical protein